MFSLKKKKKKKKLSSAAVMIGALKVNIQTDVDKQCRTRSNSNKKMP